jgi:GxxExxY protein
MNTDEEKINSLTEKIIGCAFKVHNALLCGFAERVYENALLIELREAGLNVQQLVPIVVQYRGAVVGDYIADLIVDGIVLVEIKAVRNLDEAHTAQCLNYLAATSMAICLLINFGNRVDVRRLRGKTTT